MRHREPSPPSHPVTSGSWTESHPYRTPRARPADIAPTWREVAHQLADSARTVPLTTHPGKLASMLAYALPNHGMTPAAAILGSALTWGDAVALTDDRGSLTCRQLGAATGRLAAALAGDDTIRTGTRVGLMTGDDRFGLIALGAAGLAGGVVHVINPRMGPSDLAGSVRTGLDVIIHTADCQLGDYPGKRIAVGDLGALAGRARGWPVPHRARASRLVMLTSGTTGGPAAIPIRRRWSAPLPALALAGATGVRHGVPTLVCPPIFHGYGLALAMLCLVAGSPLVMGSRCRAAGMSEVIKGAAPGRTDWGRAIATVVEETGAGAVVAVPIQLRSLAAHLDGPPGGDPASEHGAARSATSESEYENAGSATSPTEHGTVRSVMPGSEHGTVRSVMPGSEHGTVRSATSGSEHGTVRSVMSGSDPLDPDTIRTIQRHWGPVVTNYYGSTETGPVALISRADLPGRPTSVGRPVAGTRIRIVGETGSPLSRGRTGRILIDSPLVSPGGEVGWRGSYVTSDRGWVDEEGYLYLTGRL